LDTTWQRLCSFGIEIDIERRLLVTEKSIDDRVQLDRETTDNRSSFVLTPSKLRSAISNGSKIFEDVDHRSAWVRRYRDLLWAHEADAGGGINLSGGQRSIIRRATMLELQLELMDSRFAGNGGAATPAQLETYQRVANTLRRLFEGLGMIDGSRKPAGAVRDVTNSIIDQFRNGSL
jgi:hypothetical protein